MLTNRQKDMQNLVKEVGFSIKECIVDGWNIRYSIMDGETEIYHVVTFSAKSAFPYIEAWVKGYKYFCKEAWVI